MAATHRGCASDMRETAAAVHQGYVLGSWNEALAVLSLARELRLNITINMTFIITCLVAAFW